MENLTKADFTDWSRLPMTVKVRNHLLKERESMNSIDGSGLIEKNTYAEGLSSLEALGLESAMRASVIRGLDVFTNFDELSEDMFEGGADNEAET